MTKKEAIAEWLDVCLPVIRKAEQNGIDKPMRDQNWNDFTDGLCKDGRITAAQYSTWTHPRETYKR